MSLLIICIVSSSKYQLILKEKKIHIIALLKNIYNISKINITYQKKILHYKRNIIFLPEKYQFKKDINIKVIFFCSLTVKIYKKNQMLPPNEYCM